VSLLRRNHLIKDNNKEALKPSPSSPNEIVIHPAVIMNMIPNTGIQEFFQLLFHTRWVNLYLCSEGSRFPLDDCEPKIIEHCITFDCCCID